MSEFTEILDPGFYGKLPAYGDFIQKRLPRDFINPWDDWLQQGIAAAKDRLADNWLSYYLNCPAWKFVLGGQICGEQACAGVTIPSVDKVGRYFNFTVATMLPADTWPGVFLAGHVGWFDELESLAIAALEQEMDQDAIDNAINNMTVPLHTEPVSARPVFEAGDGQVRALGPEFESVAELQPALLHHLLGRDSGTYGLWWHGGSSQVSAQLLACAQMPTVETYFDLLMDEIPPETPPEETEVDYLDELLSS